MRVDDEDDYSPSDSDEEYTENEKILLNKVRNRNRDNSGNEKEVFGVGNVDDDSEDEDDQSDLALSDVEGQEDDGLPDVRAWGKDKRKFYQTDYVDGDYGGFQGKDAQLAEFEEEEARNLQKQLAKHLDDEDFALDIFSKKAKEDDKADEEFVKTDVSKLTKRQKLEILQRESPEFFSLVEDFQSKMAIAKEFLYPALKMCEKSKIQCNAVDFVQTHYELILNYCTNIYMYLLLKSSKVNIQNHPLIKRLYQYRQLLVQLEPVYEEVIKPQIEVLLSDEQTNVEVEKSKKLKKKTLKLLSNFASKNEESTKRKLNDTIIAEQAKKVRFEEKSLSNSISKNKPESSEEDEQLEEEVEENNEEKDELLKRAITYKMAKNKGLTPHRKKEQRNPRVKHKLKYRKAIIRRKGAVREPRKELSRYSGEISGIKASVSRSVKIKT